MESPVPDLFYYQRIVETESLSEGSVRYELQELIHEVKIYLGFIAKERNKFHKELNEEVLKRIEIENKLKKCKSTIKLAEEWCKDQSNGLMHGSICISAMKDIRRHLKN